MLCFLRFRSFNGFGCCLDLSYIGALVAFLNGIGHGRSNQADGTDGVIVCRNDIVDLIRVAVGINDRNDGDVQLACLGNGVVLLARVKSLDRKSVV